MKTPMNEENTPSTSEINLTTALEILADDQRRYVLSEIIEHPVDEIDIQSLAAQIAADDVSPQKVHEIKQSLRHRHIPRLRRFGAIAVDSGNMVSVTDRGTRLWRAYSAFEKTLTTDSK